MSSTSIGAGDVSVALVIGNDIHRYGLEGMLGSLDLVAAAFSHATIAEAVAAAGRHRVDVLLTSTAELACAPDPAELGSLREHGIRLLVLVGPADRLDPDWAAQAHGFVDRSTLSLRSLREAVLDAGAGRFHVSAGLARRLMTPPQAGPVVALTARELQVLRLVAGGSSNRQAARELGISENGIKRLMGNIMAKLNSPNRTLAVVRAMEIGLLKS